MEGDVVTKHRGIAVGYYVQYCVDAALEASARSGMAGTERKNNFLYASGSVMRAFRTPRK